MNKLTNYIKKYFKKSNNIKNNKQIDNILNTKYKKEIIKLREYAIKTATSAIVAFLTTEFITFNNIIYQLKKENMNRNKKYPLIKLVSKLRKVE